ncbi:molecular chaperone DnaJ [Botrimarina hoheduenensis]|uniref:Chaperone protein DnaJ n=1 Tax=Botrimarina hoheduenensis TaxID=2528000 RepID=A0A5C5WA95_9BACT|nr:molecular chaperone DnaJ [Botrimarina hoheduenensis]TWT47806.1 Chaperone protein DnaJ [Botrimarina hoheduenensis]
MATQRDYYEVLGVSRDASGDTIATAYRKLAIKYHPDKNPGNDEAIASFKEAAQAFEVLNDSEKRSRYDRFGHAGVNGAASGGGFSDVEDIFSAFGDVFGDLFGGGGGGRRGRRRGRDVRCDVSLTLHEAATGVTKTVEFQRHERCATCDGGGAAPGSSKETCGYCGGAGRVIQSAGIVRMQTTCPACQGAGQTISKPCNDCRGTGQRLRAVETEVNIPAGVDDGTRVRITGQGEPSPNGGPPGDCYCFISVAAHPLFDREGQHLIVRMPITYSQAALGCELETPTLDGRATVTLKAGTQSGDVFRLRGLGIADPHGRGMGDLLVQVTIEVPKKLSPDEERLLRELAELEHKHVAPERKSFFTKLKDYFTAHENGAANDESDADEVPEAPRQAKNKAKR